MLASASANSDMCKYLFFILRVLDNDWLDEKVISDVKIEISRQNLR